MRPAEGRFRRDTCLLDKALLMNDGLPSCQGRVEFHMQITSRAGRSSRRSRRRTGFAMRLRASLAGQGDLALAAGYMSLAGLLGGGLVTWSAAYALLAVATILFATALTWRHGLTLPPTISWTGQAGLVGIAVLPLLQLIPLPPTMWQMLPGQDKRLEILSTAGLSNSWQPMTVEPSSTALAAVLAIGFLGLVVILVRLSDRQFRQMLQIALLLVLISIAVGLLQVLSDGYPKLQVANMGATMLGVFANKNHMAMAIACSILIFGLIVSRDLLARERRKLAVIGYTGFAIVCIVTTNSRAGLALGALAALIVLADLARGVPLRWRLAVVVAVALLLMGLLSTSTFERVSSRVGDIDGDLRWRIAGWSWPLVERYALSGSGFGAFATLFATHEQLAWVKPTFVNAVHNDYLQLVIEAGLPGVAVAALMALSIVGRIGAYRSLTRRNPHRVEMTLGFAILGLFALHSGFDYPLRRPASYIFFALAIAAVYRGTLPSLVEARTGKVGSMRLDAA